MWILPISRLWDCDLQRSAAARRIPDRDAAVMQRHKLLRDAQAQTQAGIAGLRVCAIKLLESPFLIRNARPRIGHRQADRSPRRHGGKFDLRTAGGVLNGVGQQNGHHLLQCVLVCPNGRQRAVRQAEGQPVTGLCRHRLPCLVNFPEKGLGVQLCRHDLTGSGLQTGKG